MRNAFAKELFECMRRDSRIMILAGDLGYSVFDDIALELPKQYINVGVAEQNMTGIAAGLALEGKIPVIYSIVPFACMRNYEQIRNDICYQNLHVVITGVGAGFSYGPYGHTHHGLEDIGILRVLPNMTILCPGDPYEVICTTRTAIKAKGPVYLRIGKKGEEYVHKKIPKFRIGKGIIIHNGYDGTLIASSTLLSMGQKIVSELSRDKIFFRFISMHTIKPIDSKLIIDSVKKTHKIFTLEEHSVVGGLGSAVAEVIAEKAIPVLFHRFGVPDRFTKKIGYQEDMRQINGLSVLKITKKIKRLLILEKNIVNL